jgi:hypothetical protein
MRVAAFCLSFPSMATLLIATEPRFRRQALSAKGPMNEWRVKRDPLNCPWIIFNSREDNTGAGKNAA